MRTIRKIGNSKFVRIPERLFRVLFNYSGFRKKLQICPMSKDCGFMTKMGITYAYIFHGWRPEEYFFYDYPNLSRRGKHNFVSNREGAVFRYWISSPKIHDLFRDKYETYLLFKPFFKRELICIQSNDKKEDKIQEFEQFTSRHEKFIVKPLEGNLGNGVQIIEIKNYSSEDALYEYLASTYPAGCIIEELICQTAEMGALHPSSVNTVRISTVLFSNDEVYTVSRAFMRIGQGGRCVDNGGNGGIIAAIDFETGIITAAKDEAMNSFVEHPDSHLPIIGKRIPKWKEAKEMAVALAKQKTECRYCGWDLALTELGWVMVEGNSQGLFVGFQLPAKVGFREEFEYIKNRCHF